jgi:transcriptional regulator MraZ
VALFLSTFTNKVDRKGRVSVPASFRTNLSATGQNGAFVLYPSPHYAALEGCTVEHMKELSARLATLEQFSPEHDELSTLFSDSHQLSLDSEGRVGLPEELLAYAEITENVAFVGAGGTFQLWEPEAYAAHKAAMRERMKENKRTIPAARPLASQAVTA